MYKVKKGQIPNEIFLQNEVELEDIVGCWLNGISIDILLPVVCDGNISPIYLNEMEGQRIYRRSLSFLLWRVVCEVFRDTRVIVNHSMSSGYYCEVVSPVLPTKDEFEFLQKRMEKIVSKDEEIGRERVKISQAIKLFKREGRVDVETLLIDSHDEEVVIYHSGSVVDYYEGPLIQRTGMLKWFDMKPYHPGVVIHFPSLESPHKLKTWKGQKRLFKVYHEHRRWSQILEISNVGQLNTTIKDGRTGEIIRVSEALHEKKISAIADQIYSDRQKRLILISGPSSSGKTTFARRLKIGLQVNGLRPLALSLDNYFLNREETPKDEDGNYDFESPEAIDIELFKKNMDQLLNGDELEVLKFDFNTGEKKYIGRKLKLEPGHPVIVEGIHALNDILTENIEDEVKFKIYASALTQVNLDDHNRLATTDCRMIRRIVRDSQFRGYSASQTISRWSSITRGEKKWIFPFQETADTMFNSSLIYEVSALKERAEPLLVDIKPDDPSYNEAQRLLHIMNYFLNLKTNEVPPTSVLREFIAGSVFKY